MRCESMMLKEVHNSSSLLGSLLLSNNGQFSPYLARVLHRYSVEVQNIRVIEDFLKARYQNLSYDLLCSRMDVDLLDSVILQSITSLPVKR